MHLRNHKSKTYFPLSEHNAESPLFAIELICQKVFGRTKISIALRCAHFRTKRLKMNRNAFRKCCKTRLCLDDFMHEHWTFFMRRWNCNIKPERFGSPHTSNANTQQARALLFYLKRSNRAQHFLCRFSGREYLLRQMDERQPFDLFARAPEISSDLYNNDLVF